MLHSMQPVVFFLILLGLLTAYLATKKNRNPIGWFLAGMFFGLFGILFLLILPPLPNKNKNLDLSDNENETTNNILHSLLEDASLAGPASSIDKVDISTEKWFYLNKEKHATGPMSFEDLLLFLNDKGKHGEEDSDPQNIWVWKKGMQNWEKVRNVPEITAALKAFN